MHAKKFTYTPASYINSNKIIANEAGGYTFNLLRVGQIRIS